MKSKEPSPLAAKANSVNGVSRLYIYDAGMRKGWEGDPLHSILYMVSGLQVVRGGPIQPDPGSRACQTQDSHLGDMYLQARKIFPPVSVPHSQTLTYTFKCMPRKRLSYELQPDACPLNSLPNEERSHHTVDPVLRTWMASKEIQDSSVIQMEHLNLIKIKKESKEI